MEQRIEIKNMQGDVLFSHDCEDNTVKRTVERAMLTGINLRGATLQMSVPVIPDIHKQIYEAVTKEGNALDMKTWHTCETTHCRAGWAVHLAGSAGKALENEVGPNVAGALIYMASDPNLEKVPDWFASDDEAMADIKKMAGVAQ